MNEARIKESRETCRKYPNEIQKLLCPLNGEYTRGRNVGRMVMNRLLKASLQSEMYFKTAIKNVYNLADTFKDDCMMEEPHDFIYEYSKNKSMSIPLLSKKI